MKALGILFNPGVAFIAARNAIGYRYPLREHREHLNAAVEWLCRAQDVVPGGGVSAGFYPLHGGWLAPYPETTGYIIPTFLRLVEAFDRPDLEERAIRMGLWEREIQLDSGAVRGGIGINNYPIVFNTGQVILGWVALFCKTGDSKFLDSAVRASDWLVSKQDEDGKWSVDTHRGRPHAYHTRVAWPLFEVHRLTGVERYRTAAERNVCWVLQSMEPNGYSPFMNFEEGEWPNTHVIAYTLCGLLECSKYLSEPLRERALDSTKTIAETLLLLFERRKKDPDLPPMPFPAAFDEAWKPTESCSCITGSCQFVIVWTKLYELFGDGRYLNAALKLMDQVKSLQPVRARNPNIRGAMPGSFPFWGKFNPLSFPNWGTKFFVDAIQRLDRVMKGLEGDES